jgi:hypothetical protein
VVHGEGRAIRLAWRAIDGDDADGDPGSQLAWETTGAWTYALGTFATLQSLNGMAPWCVRIRGRTFGTYRSLDAARRLVEGAALAAGYALER